MSTIITADNLCKRFGSTVVFRNLSFTLSRGRIIGLLGENGVGKTTLLALMADLLKSDGGSILIDGQPVSRATRDRVSFLLEPDNFFPFMRVKDALAYYRDFFADFDGAKAERLCSDFGLELSHPIRTLSKGNKERLCLLLALSRRVLLYLLDEPAAGFDPRFKRDLVKTILTYTEEGATLVIATHLLRDMETLFDEIMILGTDSAVSADCDGIRASGKSVEEFYLEVTE